jgi:hypothetical protein
MFLFWLPIPDGPQYFNKLVYGFIAYMHSRYDMNMTLVYSVMVMYYNCCICLRNVKMVL